jgi:transcriptional regulator with XRE-family HTH domain
MNGSELHTIRKSMKLTQNEFADILGVTQPYISSVEQGRNLVTDKMVNNLKLYIHENNIPIDLVEDPPEEYIQLCNKKNDCPEIYDFMNAERRYRIPVDNAVGGYQPGTILALNEIEFKEYIPLGILYLIQTMTDRLELLRYITAIDNIAGTIRIAFDINGKFEHDIPVRDISKVYTIKSFFTQKS